ncbi:MAG: protease inhibitor I42 family protein [Candidatus Methanomethylophilaceae archaeon]|nr:protease inhibitor I42 family protein [Candidatus Methanomethylophilaceae archaeon]
MDMMRGSVLTDEPFIFSLDPDPASGFEWIVESDGGLSYEGWREQRKSPGSDVIGGAMWYSVEAGDPGRYRFVVRCMRSDECIKKVELDLQVRPRCRSVFANAWEGFPLEVPLHEEPGNGWTVEDPDGMDCRIGSDDKGRPALQLTGGPAGERWVVLSGSEGCLTVELRIQPVGRRIALSAKAREKVSQAVGANTTTGFEWRVVDDGGMVCEDRYVSDPNPGFLCGVGGRHIFEMMAESPGTYVLRAVYQRPWESYADDTLEIVLEASGQTEPDVIEAYSGKPAEIRLRSDEGRGYGWKVADSEGMSVESSYSPGRKEGEAGERVFSVTPISAGRLSFVAEYIDPEGNRIDEYRATVEASPATKLIEGTTSVGKPFVVKIPSNPTTGFQWSVEDDGGLKVKERYVPHCRDSRLRGGGGDTVYELSSDSPGDYIFKARYSRSWEGVPIKSMVVKLRVEPAKRLFGLVPGLGKRSE